MENWKNIDGFDGYQVSSRGRIRGNSGRVINMRINRTGYVDCSMRIPSNSEKTRLSVHRLVAETFIPNPKGLPQVNHKNGIKTDNRISNLEWCTGKENMKHYYEIADEVFKGENNLSSVLTDKKVLEIREKHANKKSVASLAREYKCGETTIRRVVQRVSWQHI